MSLAKTKSGKDVPAHDDQHYQKLFKVPKHMGHASVFQASAPAGKLTRYLFPDWSKDDHLDAAEIYEEDAKRAQAAWTKAADKAHQKAFGEPRGHFDYKVSGVGRDEYDEKSKDKLRKLSWQASAGKTLAAAHREAASMANRIKNFRNPVNASFIDLLSKKYVDA